jgi:hypothetical protein
MKMDCLECGATYTEKAGIYSLTDPFVGEIIVRGVSYYQCDNCGNILYSEAMAQAIESQRKERIHALLSQFPIRDFINSADTAAILGISRQALHKNRRINHGFIYQLKFGLLTLYLKQSVYQYKETGDGRFPLHLHRHTYYVEYLKTTTHLRTSAYYKPHPIPIESIGPFFLQKFISPYKPSPIQRESIRPFVLQKLISSKEQIYAS